MAPIAFMDEIRTLFILLFLILGFGIYSFGQRQFNVTLNGFESEGTKRIIALEDGGYVTKELDADWKTKNCYIVITKFNECSQEIWSKKIEPSGMPLSDPAIDSMSLLYGLYLNLNFCQTTDKGFILIYATYEPTYLKAPFSGNPVPVVTKLDSAGNILWSRTIDPIVHSDFSGRYPVLQSCVQTNDGGCSILGYSDSTDYQGSIQAHSMRCYLLKLDAGGKTVWSKIFKLQDTIIYPSFAFFGKLQPLKNGGFLFSYMNESSGLILLYRLDQNGNLRWEKYLSMGTILVNTTFKSFPIVYAEDNDKNIYISGSAFITNDTDTHISTSSISTSLTPGLSPFLLKLDSNGLLKWFSGYFESASLGKWTANLGLIISKGNNPILINYLLFQNYYSRQTFLLSTDTSGKPFWNKGLNYSNSITTYEEGEDGSDFIEHSATIDSGFIFIETGQDSVYSRIFKIDKNGLSSCSESDISIKRILSNISITSANLSSPVSGFTVSDAIVSARPFKEKAIFNCSDNFIPAANLGSDTILCLAKSYTLHKGSQNAGTTTYWSTGDTTDSIIITQSGKYWLQLSHGFCTSSDTVTVVFKSNLKTGLPKKISFCPYDSAILKVSNLASSYSGSSLWYWITPKKDTVAGDSLVAKDTGYYYLMLNATQCPNMDTVHITHYLLPNASAGPDTILCYNETYTMQGSGGISYTWRPAKYLSSSTDPKAEAKLPNTEFYTLIVRSAQGCEDSNSVLLKVHPKLEVTAITNNTYVCYGRPIILSAKASGGDSFHYQFSWTNDQLRGDTIFARVYQTGWHRVVLNDNCSPDSAMDSVYVTVTPPAKAEFIYSPAIKIKTNHSINFTNRSTNASSYLWTFGTNDSSIAVSPVHIYTDSGDYKITLIAYGLNNCPNDTAYGYIKIISDQITIYIPNAFSPNGDGINDFFDITGAGIKSYSYNIYNRWGEHIFSGMDAWDGNFKGQQVPEGIYLYTIDVIDVDGIHHYLSGSITLMR